MQEVKVATASRRTGGQEGVVGGGVEGPDQKGTRPGRSQQARPPPQPAPLYTTPGHLLDKFIKDFLQPNKIFLEQIERAVKIIRTFLQHNCFQHSTTKIQKIVQVSAGPPLEGYYWQGAKKLGSSARLCPTRGLGQSRREAGDGRGGRRCSVLGARAPPTPVH